MTTKKEEIVIDNCPAEGVLKLVSGKWKPQILRLAVEGPVRFNSLLRKLTVSNKQSVAIALKELEEANVLIRTIIKKKPLHVEYSLSDRGRAWIPIFTGIEDLA